MAYYMNFTEKIEYIFYILTNNGFLEFEVKYYRGESNNSMNPHGIDKRMWKVIANKIGFNMDNMRLIGNKYYWNGYK